MCNIQWTGWRKNETQIVKPSKWKCTHAQRRKKVCCFEQFRICIIFTQLSDRHCQWSQSKVKLNGKRNMQIVTHIKTHKRKMQKPIHLLFYCNQTKLKPNQNQMNDHLYRCKFVRVVPLFFYLPVLLLFLFYLHFITLIFQLDPISYWWNNKTKCIEHWALHIIIWSTFQNKIKTVPYKVCRFRVQIDRNIHILRVEKM